MKNRIVALTGLATGAALVGGGLTAFADQSSTPAPVAASASASATPGAASHTAAHARRGHHRHAMAAALHATWVTKGKAGFVTHDAIHGTVTAVSPTSITVKAADGYSESFTVTKTTKLAQRAPRPAAGQAKAKGKRVKPTVIPIGAVKVGEKATVTGTGSSQASAVRIVVAA